MADIATKLREYFKDKGITQQNIADRFGVALQSVNPYMTGAKPFGKKTAQKWAKEFGLSVSWLLTGEGDMLAEAVATPGGLPLLDGEIVTAGALAGFGEPLSPKDIAAYIQLPALRWREGDFAIYVRGRSMIDREHPEGNIPDGSIVCLHPLTSPIIQWGEIYCIATHDGYTVKRLMPSDDDDCIRCVSNNEAEGYKPYDVPKAEIVSIARVTGVITLQLL